MDEARCRICMVLPDLRVGGAQRVLLSLAAQFARMGHQVTLVTLLGGGALVGEVPIEVRRITLFERPPRLPLAPCSLLKLRARLKRGDYDAVLSTMTGTNLVTVLAQLLARTKSRLVLREAASLASIDGGAIRWFVRKLYPKADAVIAVSEGVRLEFAAMGITGVPVHAIRNPIDAGRLRANAAMHPLPPVLRDRPYIVSVGRLVSEKDYGTLLRAYARSQLAKTHLLVIVGDGPQRGALSDLALQLEVGGKVVLLGEVPNPYPIMSNAQLFVLSSRSEGYPNALLEALTLGVAVVATAAPCGVSEILHDGRYGRIVAVGDAASLAQAMDEAVAGSFVAEKWPVHTHALEAVATQYLHLLVNAGNGQNNEMQMQMQVNGPDE